MQETITDTQLYIEALETELQFIQTQTVSNEEIALIRQFLNIENELSLERSRLSNAIRTQGSNFGTLNDNSSLNTPSLSKLKEQVVSHIDLTEKLVQDSRLRIEELEDELQKLGGDFDFSAYYLTINAIERQNEIEKTLSQERARLGDQTRTLAILIETHYAISTNPNEITIIEPADISQEVDNLLGIKVASSAVAGLIIALIIVILFDTLRMSPVSTEEATLTQKTKGKR